MTSTSRIPEKILSYRSKDNGVDQYLVKFRNLGIAYSSWMTTDQIGNPAMVHKYRQSAKLDEPTQPPSSSLSSGDSSSTTTTTTTTTITSSLVAAAVAAATATVNALSFGNSPQREKKEIKESKYDGNDRDTDDDSSDPSLSPSLSSPLTSSPFVSGDPDYVDDEDDSWMKPAAKVVVASSTPHVTTTEIKPFKLDPDSKEVPSFVTHVAIASWGGIRPSDLLAVEHAMLLTNDYLIWRSKPMVVPQSTMFRTSGVVRLPRVRTKKAEALARSNTRYLLGCLIAVGFPRANISLDMFAFEEIIRAFLVCIDTRKLGSERRYQLMLELRTVTWWIATRQPARIGLDKVASAAFVERIVAKEKRDAAKKREQTDGDTLTKSGKWLTPQDQAALTKSIAGYFTRDRLNPTVTPMQDEAWRFQGHFIMHLLNDDVIAVPRSELLGSLQRGTTCVFEKDSMQWIFKMDFGHGKTKAPTILKVPHSSNGIIRAWLKFYRPVLVHDEKHEYILNGSAPRTQYRAQVRALQEHYIGKSATPHAFRGMQATQSREAGIGNEEHAALCWSRQHSTATCKRFYEKPTHKRMADMTEIALGRMRQKRQKLVLQNDEYAEVPAVVDEEIDEE